MVTGARSTFGRPPKRFKWSKRIIAALLIYTIIGFFVVPAVIKSQMLKRLPGLTKRQATVRQVRFNPYALSLTIRGFLLKEPDGEVFSSFDEFYINFQLWASLFKRSWVFREISLKGPFAQVTYREDGSFNFANLLGNSSPTPQANKPVTPQPPPRVIVYDLNITNGSVAFADLKRKDPFRTQFLPINVNLTNLTTIRDRNSPYMFLARTASGESFAWSGTITLNPLRSAGLFRLGGLKLGTYSTYSHDYARFEIVNGMLDVAADYRYDSETNALDLEVSKATVHLNNLELKAPDTGEAVVTIPSFSITDTEASVAKRTARVGLIKSSGGTLLVRQNHDRTINLLSLLNPLPAAGNQSTNENASPWAVKIDEIAFDNYAVKAEDKEPDAPAAFNIDQLAFDLKGVSNASNAPVAVSLSLRYQKTGSLAVNGAATLMPPSADMQIAVTNIDLRSLGPYVAEQVKLAITGGALSLNGKARFAPPEPGAPLASFDGNLLLTKFATTDDILFKGFTTWDLLSVDGIQVAMRTDKLSVGAKQVLFDGLKTSLIVGPDRRINLQTILRNQIAAGTNKSVLVAGRTNGPTPTAVTAIPEVALGALVLKNTSLHFDDESLEPHCSFDVQELSGSIKGLSSKENTTATLDLKGKVDSRSPFSVTGRINPLAKDLFADVTVTFTNTELTAFTPYLEKYAGRPLQKGKLSFAVHYLIQKNTLKAENGIFIDQLTLGAKNNSTNATKLPVKLAIALLKDIHGRIKLDIPVRGQMNDPKFKVGPIIWQVVVNIMEKAATSPFSLLGALVGGGGEEMSFVVFDPGQSLVAETEAKKLDKLATALHARPTLTLEINGSVDPVKDRLPLAALKLDQQIKSLRDKELTDSGKPAIALEQVVLEPKERERLLKKIYKQEFGRYKPTEVVTNQSPAVKARDDAARVMASIAREAAHEHGASLLRAEPIPPPPPLKAMNAVAAAQGRPSPPKSRYELELADMEDQLLQKMQISDDDLRDLMQQRAKQVQGYLLKTEKVTPDQLFITAPKPLGPSSKGEDRVNLSLD